MNISMGISFVLFSFLFFLFIIFIISLFKKQKFSKLKSFANVSVLIPTFNEEKNIVNCLNSVLNSNYNKKNLEIIVVDDESKDDTVNIVEKFIEKIKDYDIKLIKAKHQGKSGCLNLGVKHAKNEFILTIDADVVILKDTIKKLVTPLVEKNVGATNSVAYIRKPKKFIEYFQMIEFCLNNLIRTSFSKVFKNSIWFFGAVACYKKSILKEVGYFKKDTLTEDMDICLEIFNKKYKIVTVEDCFISTLACPSVLLLFKQRMRWYFGALQSLFKNKRLLKGKKRSAPVIFLFVNQYWWTFFSFVFFPMTIYQVYYWIPSYEILEFSFYIFRWFSLLGPFYVFYMMPEWGFNFLNIFGVMSGVLTFIMGLFALIKFKGVFRFKTFFGLFFYFPYTIILAAIIVSGVIKYTFSKKKYFIN
ncbi:MAG: glycosyltransferase [Nanoarchaeota archaeon]